MPSGLNGRKPPIVFFDFDNTVTRIDVLDAVIERFSIDEKWIACEEAWKAGRIGARECLEAQLQSVRVTRKELTQYVKEIPVDPHFPRLLKRLKEKGIPSMIVSDSFSFMIKTILRYQGIRHDSIYANELRFEKDRLVPSFPYASKECTRCAHCKKIHVLAHADKTRIYIGDGLSDVCPALEADVVFAKGSLFTRLKAEGKPCTEFRDLEKIFRFFDGIQKNSDFRKVMPAEVC